MKVYAIPVECYDCHKAYDALSYIHFAAFYDDVSFPYEEWMMNEVYAHLHPSNQYFHAASAKDTLSYPVHTLGYNDELDQKVLASSQIRGIKMLYSRQRYKRYPMNICPHCGAPFGGYDLCRIITDQYLYPNRPLSCFAKYREDVLISSVSIELKNVFFLCTKSRIE